MENDNRHGKGKLYYKNGKLKLEGNFVNDKLEGFGKFIHETGFTYIGEMKNAQQMEKGRLFSKWKTSFYSGVLKEEENMEN